MKTIILTAHALSLCAMRGPIHRSAVRFDKEMTEAEFQAKVLDTQKQAEEKSKKAIDEITLKFENAEKDTKKAYDALMKSLKDQSAKTEEIELANKKLNLQIAKERSNNLGNPLQRITSDEEKCARMAAVICRGHGFGPLAQKVLKQAGIIGKAEGEDSGFGADLITPDLEKDIYDSLPLYGAWNTLGVRRLGTKVTEFPVKTARALAQFITTEGAAIAEDSTKAGTSVTATVRPIGTLLSVSRQLLEDSPLDVVADVMNDFIEGNAQCMDYAGFSGNGTVDATNGGFTGIFNAGTAAVAASGHTSFGALTYNDVLSVLTSVDEVVLQRQARWWMHPFALVTLMGIKDTTGRPIFQSILERPAPNAIGSILGYPVTLVSNAPYTSGTSAPFAAFGDPQSAVMGLRHDFQFEYSDDYHFNTWQRAFRGISRIAFAVRKATAFAVLTTAAS